jgi:DNA-directed RNA polymerase beta subunit
MAAQQAFTNNAEPPRAAPSPAALDLTPVLVDSLTQRENIRRKAVEALAQAFPLQTKNYTIELRNPRIETREFSSREQKQAILEGSTLNERVRAGLVVKDSSGRVVDQVDNFTLLHLPYFTPRHTFVLDGNEYSVSNQIRTKPGVYTRRRGNEDLEAAFNLAKGANFRLSMDPEKAQLRMEYGTTRIPLYPVLRALGVPHQDIAWHWGAQVAALNRDAVKSADRQVDKLYAKLIPPARQAAKTTEDRAAALRAYYDATVMDPEVNRATLGEGFDRVTPGALLAASKKLLDVHRAAVDTDDRDSLEYKTFHSVDDFIKERIGLDARALKTKLGLKLDAAKGDIRQAIPSGLFTRSINSFLTNSSLSAIPTQINPMELIDHAVRVTSLGEGGIASERAIPLEARNLHPTHLALMDPVRTPESFKAGVDIRAALSARRDDRGNLYAPFTDVNTGRKAWLKPADIMKAVIAFPGETIGWGKLVDALDRGEVARVPSAKVSHQLEHHSDLYGPTTNLLPLLNGMQGNRSLMASKHQSQALSLVHREPPLVQVKSWNPDTTVEKEMVKLIVPTAPVAGRITKIDDDYIYLEPSAKKAAADEEIYSDFLKLGGDDGLLRLHYDTHFPLAAKTYLHNELKVKPGDHVEAGQPLADSNFTKEDALALGTNLRVAYLAYRGLNSNDGIVVSQGAADKLASEHMYKIVLLLDGGVETKREKHRAYFGAKYTAKQYDALDEDGVIRPGTVVQPHDPVIVALRPNTVTGNAALLGRLSKSLVKPYRDETLPWDHDHSGQVVDVVKAPGRITVTVKTIESLQIGDKLSGRYGNKGVVSKIIPDHQVVQDEQGRPIHLLFTSAGIVSRINPAQVVEAALGKVAEHTGKPIAVENFAPHDNVQFAKKLLAQHGLKDKETIYDPVADKKIPGVFVGRSYILKLFKTTDSNWSAHGAERYDVNEQPARGGDDGAKAIGKMEFDALVAHNARNILREAASIKSQRNDEFWRAIQLGLPTPAPQTSFAYNKFLNLLEGAGVKVNKQGTRLALGPLTDGDIENMSSGAIKDGNKLIRAKDLAPEPGGLFDPATTGGTSGTKWSHVELHEPIVNPVFEEPVRRLLGLTTPQFRDLHGQHGGSWFKRELGKIDVDRKLDELKAQTKSLTGARLDDAVKQMKYLSALKDQNLTPARAYVLLKVPVTPPVIRPILPLQDGRIQVSDVNLLYRDAFLANQQLGSAKGVLPDAEIHGLRNHLYEAVGAVFGTHDPVSPTAEKRRAKGYLALIAGTRPGSGFFQSKLLKRQQDVSGRATIAPDPTLSMDEIGVPEDMLWATFGKFVVGRLVRRGYPALDAQKMVEDKHPLARHELLNETKERPVFVNRPPTLHKESIVAGVAKPTKGKTLLLNPFAERGMNADYDGDALQIHAPVTAAGVADAKKLLLSNQLFADRKPGFLNVAPDMEAVIGLHRATQHGPGPVRKFRSKQEALAAYRAGEIQLPNPVAIG